MLDEEQPLGMFVDRGHEYNGGRGHGVALPPRSTALPGWKRSDSLGGGGMCIGLHEVDASAFNFPAPGCLRANLCSLSFSAARGSRLDSGRLLQRPPTSAARMGHVRVRDRLLLLPGLPGPLPLWHGDSD